jgi:hypothetical protein
MDYLKLYLGLIIVSTSISYGWWVRIRIIRLRRDIFDIRDSLFDFALSHDCLREPFYKKSREHFNSIAKSAYLLTGRVILYSLSRGVEKQELSKTENKELLEKVNNSFNDLSLRLQKYFLKETLLGFFVLIFIKLIQSELEGFSINKLTSKLFVSQKQHKVRDKLISLAGISFDRASIKSYY